MAVSRKAMTEGIRTFLFPGTPCECKFDNPSVKNQRFLPAVHCGMTATGSHVILIRCAEHHPLHKGAGVLPHQCVF